MGQRFNENLKNYFKCDDGAFSKVTVRESVDDSQITVTGYEKTIIEGQFSRIHRGSVRDLEIRGIDPSVQFKLYPNGSDVVLNLVYPKLGKSELRLYLQTNAFKPAPHFVWFVFVKGNETWIGALAQNTFEMAKSGALSAENSSILIDIGDEEFQAVVNQPNVPGYSEQLSKRIQRDPALAKAALDQSGYKCELAPTLPTFTSRATGMPYLEVHHVVPISLQPQFGVSLDVMENISVLNPLVHRELHHGEFIAVRPKLDSLANSRRAFLSSINLTENDLVDIYRGS